MRLTMKCKEEYSNETHEFGNELMITLKVVRKTRNSWTNIDHFGRVSQDKL